MTDEELRRDEEVDNEIDDLDEDEDGEGDEEEEDDFTIATCPICDATVDFDGGCRHFAFVYGFVNFGYCYLNPNFERAALAFLAREGYPMKELTCPLSNWSRDDTGRTVPDFENLIPDLEVLSDLHFGMDGWGFLWAFRKDFRLPGARVRKQRSR